MLSAFVALFLTGTAINSSAMISVCSGPDLKTRSRNYVGNREPLANAPFIKLPVGSTQPSGWLGEYLLRQKRGLTGHLGEISAWLQKDKNAWLSKGSDFGWEEVPYWLKGYANLGYILKDKEIISESRTWIEAVLASQQQDGDFGPVSSDAQGVEDFWPKMIMLYCLQSYFEQSGDVRVLPFMARYFRYQLSYPESKFLKSYWQNRRGGDNLHSVLWLYNITGEKWLLQLAEKLHRSTMDWKPKPIKDGNWFQAFGDWHNVNIAQGFREPAIYSQISKQPGDRAGSKEAFDFVRNYFGQVPGGMFGSDENAREGHSDPQQGVETCGMVEQMNSDEELFRITGEVAWADHAENVAFNTYPAAVMPDFRSLRYITSPNMVLNDAKDHSPGIANSGPFLMMNPFSSRCCQHNHAMGWPYYAENVWMATCDNGLAATLYSAGEVSAKVAKGQLVHVTQETKYPFKEDVNFTLRTDRPVKFPLYLRIPEWCQGSSVSINRGAPQAGVPGKFFRIEREWKNGDKVTLSLPMAVSVTRWKANQNSASINFGPLTFSLKIGEKYVQVASDKTAIGDSKWQKTADPSKWPSYEIHATTPWNYGLLLNDIQVQHLPWPKSNFPFTPDEAPVILRVAGRQIPDWKIDAHGLCGSLMPSPVNSSSPIETLTLIPMGAARLRISAFPVLAK